MKAISRLLPVCLFILISLPATLAVPAPTAPGPLTADPIWCPVGVTPVSGRAGCSPSFDTMTELLTWLRANDPNAAGVIWISAAYDSAPEGVAGFIFDGRTLPRMGHYPLTIQGGWLGFGTVVDHTDRSSFTGDFLRIYMWNSSVTINDILVDGASDIGIEVFASGDMTLSNVDSQNNTGGGPGSVNGAALHIYAPGSGNVTVRDSTFNANQTDGLSVVAAGAISLDNVTANGNRSSGASLDNRPDTSLQPVSLTGMNTFSDNGSGLYVWSKGPIVVHEITVSRNGSGDGAYFDNMRADSPQPVSLLGNTHVFTYNHESGLVINSRGEITAENITTNYNNAWGTILANNFEGGAGALTLSGENTFYRNGVNGLNALSNGTIALFGVSTDSNDRNGVLMMTPYGASLNCAKIYSSGEYGVDAQFVSGPLTLNDVAFDFSNASGNYSYSGTPAITTGGCLLADGLRSGAPMRTIEYIPDPPITLDCSNYGGTQFDIPYSWQVIFRCPTLGDAVIRLEDANSLPAPLPDKRIFVSALTLSLKEKEGEPYMTAGLTTLSFPLPKDTKGQNYDILYWTGKQWVDLKLASFQDGRIVFDGGTMTSDGSIKSSVNFTGTFVLVSE